ncbi:MAG: iron-sulfur cluster assembly accessory protein [Fimbriimonadaceae bacterium]|nr:iron-sulfur cluster assembly accessory protein [Fimbriimonadaceae bacterium]QYK55920.1 MAG: iron-sulfur cluster assembly accessory protein [Fimbriimonadaceae bacterium]
MTTPFPLEIEERAAAELVRAAGRKGVAFLRVGVKGGGCSGLEYVVRPEEAARESDLVLELAGVTLLCDPRSAEFLQGAKLVWTGNLLTGGFSFENPNAARSCGCGTSFTPKAEEAS